MGIGAGPPGEAAAACWDGGPAFRGGNGTTQGNRAHTETGLSLTRNSKTLQGSFVPRLTGRSQIRSGEGAALREIIPI